VASRPDVRARHLAQREGTHRRILDTALALLEERRWHEITLEQVMAEAGLTRTAFYRHFPNREALLGALLEDLGVRLEDLPASWQRGDGEPIDELRRGVEALTTLYARIGHLLAAVAEAATHNDEIRALYFGLADRLIVAVAERIAADVEAGRSEVEDPLEVARALIWMNEGYLQSQFGREPQGDQTRATAVLSDVWIATIYGRRP
jgi:TetR/AcrR family transcriptional regulator, ethionamide resistance regulator